GRTIEFAGSCRCRGMRRRRKAWTGNRNRLGCPAHGIDDRYYQTASGDNSPSTTSVRMEPRRDLGLSALHPNPRRVLVHAVHRLRTRLAEIELAERRFFWVVHQLPFQKCPAPFIAGAFHVALQLAEVAFVLVQTHGAALSLGTLRWIISHSFPSTLPSRVVCTPLGNGTSLTNIDTISSRP